VLIALGEATEAAACLDRVASLRPELSCDPATYLGLGNLLVQRGEIAQAVKCYQRAVAAVPDLAVAHSNLGNVRQAQGRLDAAIACYDRALSIAPDSVDALLNRGNALCLRGRLGRAIASFERAVALRPSDPVARAHLAHPKALACAWGERAAEEAAVLSAIEVQPGSVPPFNLLSQRSTLSEQQVCARGWTHRLTSSCGPAFVHGVARRDRIRLGYISADFREHPVGRATVGLLEAHDRAAFEVNGYSYGPDDGSALRPRIAAACDRFIDLRELGDADAAQRIRTDDIDILVDLTGHTRDARPRILAVRPARVQVNFLGFAGTMGADFIDAIIVDPFLVPPDQQPFFDERLVPVRCWWPASIPRAIGGQIPSREDYGLPSEGFVFACFNNSYKITPEVFDVWMRLLSSVPGSVLWLSEANRLVAGNLRREAALRGIQAERLFFAAYAPIEAHLARHRLADLFVDTLPNNACSTGYFALWAGLPLLTCAGATFASRMAGTMLHTVGLPELVTHSLADYEHRALQLAREPGSLGRLRERLAQQHATSLLFDATRAARDLEAAYARLWHDWCSGREA
jgi:predicted O-linked N-acetylglucosamine transferase (SPINDLY family)